MPQGPAQRLCRAPFSSQRARLVILQKMLQEAFPGTLQADTKKQAMPVTLSLCKGKRQGMQEDYSGAESVSRTLPHLSGVGAGTND